MARKVVIVGAGQAGFQVAASLRGKKFAGHDRDPRRRAGAAVSAAAAVQGLRQGRGERELAAAAAGGVLSPPTPSTCGSIRRVAAIDRAAHEVVLADGERVAYDSLVLATGARVRPLPVPGAELAGVVYVRTLADAVALKPQIEAAKNVVVVGGGFIGLECAAVASHARLQGRGAGGDGPPDGARGVAGALGLLPRPASQPRRRRAARRVGDGDRRRGRPRDRRALRRRRDACRPIWWWSASASSPMTTSRRPRGLPATAASSSMRICAPPIRDIYAIGDCAAFPHPMAQGLVRLEVGAERHRPGQDRRRRDHGRRQALRGGAVVLVRPVRRQAADRRPDARTTTTRSRSATSVAGRFSVLYFRNGGLIGIDSVNKPSDHVVGRKLFGAGKSVTIDAARAPDFSLRAQV